jgi:uncharacterized delta-60 repeat protein
LPRFRLVAVLICTCVLGGAVCADALAVPGELDRTFNKDGKLTTNFTSGWDSAADVVIQADGKIIAAGTADYRFVVVRYRSGGTLDPTFGGGDAKVRTRFGPYCCDFASAVALQPDGKIVVAGTTYIDAGDAEEGHNGFALARYNPDGTLDSTFSGDGKVTTDFPPYDSWFRRSAFARGVVLQTDGKIVVAGGVNWEGQYGTGEFALVRYNADGTLDSTFGDGGRVVANVSVHPDESDDASAVAMQADGKIVAAGGVKEGTDIGLARFNPDGTLDSTFGDDGTVTTDVQQSDWAAGLVIQEDGKIITAGPTSGSSGQFALVRYSVDGSLDTTFDGDGKVTTDFTARPDYAFDVALQVTGKIVAVGMANGTFALARFALARYKPDGTLDQTFSGDGKVMTQFTVYRDVASAVVIQPDTKIVVAGVAGEGDSKFALARYRGG